MPTHMQRCLNLMVLKVCFPGGLIFSPSGNKAHVHRKRSLTSFIVKMFWFFIFKKLDNAVTAYSKIEGMHIPKVFKRNIL